MHRDLTSRVLLPPSVALALTVGVAGCATPRVDLRVPALANAESIVVRVWNTEGELVDDRWLTVGQDLDLPWTFSLTAKDGAPARWYRAEVTYLDADHCPIGRGVERGPSPDGVVVQHLEVMTSPSSRCAAIFVDPSAPDDTESCGDITSPCPDVTSGRAAHPRASGVSRVFYLLGGVDHGRLPWLQDSEGGPYWSGEEGTPTVFRSWPGTGHPIVRGVLVGFRDLAARYLVFDGLEITGARTRQDGTVSSAGAGLSFNGQGGDAVVRNCVIHDNGRGEYPSSSASAGIKIWNGGTQIVIEDNLIFDNGGLSQAGKPEGGGIAILPNSNEITVRRNRIWNNVGPGVNERWVDLDRRLLPGVLIVEGNVICRNQREGVTTHRDGAVLRRNTIAFNTQALRGPMMRREQNLLVSNYPSGESDLSSLSVPEREDRSTSDWLQDEPRTRSGEVEGDVEVFFISDGPVSFVSADDCVLPLLPESAALGRDTVPGAFGR